jgi:integrase/recombinase XerD
MGDLAPRPRCVAFAALQLLYIAPLDLVALTSATTDQGILDTWLAQHEGSPHTRRAYERIGRRFLAVLAVPLRSATLEDMRKAFGAISVREDGSPAAGATAAAQIAIVKSLLSFGARVRYLEANLGELFKLKPVLADRARRIMSEPDMFLLRSAEGARDALLLETGYYGGLRVSELVSLTWGRLLDREDGKMQIAGLVGKGGKEREVLQPADLAARLRAHRQGAEHVHPVFKGRPSTLRTATDRPAEAISARAVAKIIKRTAERAALPSNVKAMVSPHWLRHAHASHALDNGAPISLVQQTLGHGNIKTTSIYAHAKPGDSSALYLKKLR